MQQEQQRERRSKNAARVELETRVEICGRDKATRPFEARSVEVSGRGMQIRARALPEIGAPLVLRFEHDGLEVVVEGDVAWCREGKKGGDFGVRFTAIDSQSVIALKEICAAQAAEAETPEVNDAEEPEADVGFDSSVQYGSPIKLHIQGLAAPMKARVVDVNAKRLKVGSKLDFLKLGQALAMEDVTTGDRRQGQVHAVSVQVDPESQVPQLVVSVHYDGADELTPQPSVVDAEERARRKRKAAKSKRDEAQLNRSRHSDDEDVDMDSEGDETESDLDEDEELYEAEAAFKGRVVQLVGAAASAVQGGVRAVGESAGGVVRSLLGAAQRRRENFDDEPAPLRRTSPGASRVSTTEKGVQRKVNRNRVSQRVQAARGDTRSVGGLADGFKKPVPLLLSAAALITGAYFTFRSEPTQQFQNQANALVTSPSATPQPAGNFAPPTPLNNQVIAVAQAPRGIVANVPLFGQTTLATSEAAPVVPGAPRGGIDEYSLSKDQAFEDSAPARPNVAAAARLNDDRPSAEATAFRFGRMQDPVLHRLRLDAPGVALQGEKTASGYVVTIPGRKVMENGTAILHSEARLSDVRVNNSPGGSKVIFRFSKEAPNFKARLRNDYVEFLINPPPAPAVSSVKGNKRR